MAGDKENIYEDQDFFQAYAKMSRSQEGLVGAGEWHQLQPLFPEVGHKKVLDMGCGYGWHSKYAVEQGAESVLAFDLSARMIDEAKKRNDDSRITYRVCGVKDYEYPANTYDLVISNLVLHYIADLEEVYRAVYRTLKPGGVFLFNIEHPVFTAGINEEWIYNDEGKPMAWPVDNYFYPGERKTHFLGSTVIKQHHTLTQILNGLLQNGFSLERVEEAQPSEAMLAQAGMKDEMRRPMMLLVKAVK